MPHELRQTDAFIDDIDHLPVEIKENLLSKTHKHLEDNPKHPGLDFPPF